MLVIGKTIESCLIKCLVKNLVSLRVHRSDLGGRGIAHGGIFCRGSRLSPNVGKATAKCVPTVLSVQSQYQSGASQQPERVASRLESRMTDKLPVEERFVGCLVGGACGDALGSAVEMMHHQAIVERYGELGVKTFDKIYDYPGAFTDDTQMTLFTAEGLLSTILRALESNQDLAAFQAEDTVPGLHQSYLRWLATQNEVSQSPLFKEVKSLGMLVIQEKLNERRGPGQTCRMAIKSGAVGSDQNKINDSKGCGGIMRVAPCGLIVHSAFDFLSSERKADLAFKLGNVSAAITHTHPSGWLPSGCQASIIAWILSGETLEDAISKTSATLEKEPDNEETMTKIHQAQQLAREFLDTFENGDSDASALAKQKLALKHIELLGRGFVGEEALGISLYCALICGKDIETGICYSVNHGGDSDSTGAMTGNILGALFGEAAIPSKWRDNVELGDLIREISRDLLKVTDPACRQDLLTKYPPPVLVHKGEEYYKTKANLVTPPFKMPPGAKFFAWANSV